MKEETIRDILHKYNYNYNSHATIFATIKPNVAAVENGLGNLLYANKSHILHLNSQGIVVLPLDEMSGSVEEELITLIPEKDILEKELLIRPMSFRLIIKTKKGDINYHVRRGAVGCPWHKENLSFLLLNTTKRSESDEV